MLQGFTDIILIVDRSGSMNKIKTDTEGGFNNFIQEQHKVEGKCNVSLYQFNSHYHTTFEDIPLDEVPSLHLSPSGNTALLDAIGMTITSRGVKYATMPDEEHPEHVVVVIVTDGEENCSTRYTKDQIKSMIQLQTDVYKWNFVYLGANQDAITVATSMGMSRGSSMTYSDRGIGSTYSSASAGVGLLRSRGIAINFSDADRAQAISGVPDPDAH